MDQNVLNIWISLLWIPPCLFFSRCTANAGVQSWKQAVFPNSRHLWKGLKSLSVSSQPTASPSESEGDVEDFILSKEQPGQSLQAQGGRADIFICGSLKSCSSQYVFNGNNKSVTTQQCQLSSQNSSIDLCVDETKCFAILVHDLPNDEIFTVNVTFLVPWQV